MTPERLAEIRLMPHDNWRIVRELLDHIAQLEAQRGGAVVVPNRSPEEILAMIHRIWDAEPTASNYSLALGVWKEAQASTQPVPASQVLQPGMVGVDREELMYLHALERYARKHGPDSIQDVVGTLDHLRRAQQVGGE